MGVLLRRAKNFGLESRRHAMNMPKVNMVAETTPSHSLLLSSKYPPAEPEALRLLAPQRGLIATAEKQKQLQRHEAREATGFGKTKATAGGILPEFSKFDCLPGRAGGTPISLVFLTKPVLLRPPRFEAGHSLADPRGGMAARDPTCQIQPLTSLLTFVRAAPSPSTSKMSSEPKHVVFPPIWLRTC